MNDQLALTNHIHSYNTMSSNLLRVPKGLMNVVNTSTRLWNVLLLIIDVNVNCCS